MPTMSSVCWTEGEKRSEITPYGPLRQGRLVLRGEPGAEEVVQLLSRHLLGEGGELGRARVAVAVLGRPGLEQLEEGGVADPLAQHLERHGAAGVDGPGEHRVA